MMPQRLDRGPFLETEVLNWKRPSDLPGSREKGRVPEAAVEIKVLFLLLQARWLCVWNFTLPPSKASYPFSVNPYFEFLKTGANEQHQLLYGQRTSRGMTRDTQVETWLTPVIP